MFLYQFSWNSLYDDDDDDLHEWLMVSAIAKQLVYTSKLQRLMISAQI